MDSPEYTEQDFARAAGRELRRLRKKKGISQEAAAEATGITRQYLTRLEGGNHKPGAYLLAASAEFYKLPLAELMERIEARARKLAERRR